MIYTFTLKYYFLYQFPLPHSRGSSHGQSRIVRYGYSQAFHTALMPEAFQMWDEIEKKAGKVLIRFVWFLFVFYFVLPKRLQVSVHDSYMYIKYSRE